MIAAVAEKNSAAAAFGGKTRKVVPSPSTHWYNHFSPSPKTSPTQALPPRDQTPYQRGVGASPTVGPGKLKLKTDVYVLFLYSSHSGTTKEAEMKRVEAVEPVFASLAMPLDAEIFHCLV